MSEIEDILNARDEEEPAAEPVVETNNDSIEFKPPDDEGLEVDSLEVGGVIRDKFGNTWQVPGDNTQDLDDLYAGDIYKIPPEMEKEFHVQMIRLDQVQEYVLRHFALVRQTELGIPAELIKMTGHPLDGYHVVGDAVMVKIPRVIRDRIEANKVKEVKNRLMQLEPTPEMTKKSGIDAGLMVEHRIGFTSADPSKRQGMFVKE